MEARPLIRRPDRCETNLSIDAGAGHDDFLFEEGPDNVAHHAARYGDALDLPPRSSNLNVPELRIFGVRFEQRALHLHDRHLRGGRQPSRRRVGRIRRNQSPPDQSLRWHELVAGHSQRDAPLTRYRAGPPRRAYSMAVRIVTAGSHTENGIAEVQFRDTVNGAKLAVGGTASASSYFGAGNEPSLAFDGNAGTAWFTGAGLRVGGWVGYTLPTPAEIRQVSLTAPSFNAGMPLSLAVEYYDGSAWQTAWTTPSTGWTSNQVKLSTAPYP